MTPDEVREIVREEVREAVAAEFKRVAEESLLMLSMSEAAGTSELPLTKMLLDEMAPIVGQGARDDLQGDR